MGDRLGDLLLEEGLVSRDALKEALDRQKAEGGRLGFHLVKLGTVSEEDLVQILSEQYGMPAIDLRSLYPHVDRELLGLVNESIATRYHVFPVHRTGNHLTLAMADPTNVVALDDIRFRTGCEVEPVLASEFAIKEAIEGSYEERRIDIFGAADAQASGLTGPVSPEEENLELLADEDEIDASNLEALSADAPVVRIVNRILVDSISRGASDIHIEPYEKDFRIRLRIDGVLNEYLRPPGKMRDAIISRIKILAKLDIAERRLPQDGRIKIKMKIDGRSREMDYRVSSVPTLHGEKVVLRLLDKENLALDLTKLGFEAESYVRFEKAILKPWGMVLVTGPTGSGKTNTLYSSIARVNTTDTNIMTAEDPVEFNLHGINQVQTKESIGLTFAEALRAFLRQDPNIILIGEIRDFETAETAGEHGDRALPGCDLGQPDRGPAACAPGLPRLQAADRSPAAGADRHRVLARGSGDGHGDEGPRLRHLQQHRLQGTGRPVRDPRGLGRHPRDDPHRLLGARAQAARDRGGDDHPPPLGPPEDQGRRHHDRRSGARDGVLVNADGDTSCP